MNGRYLLDTNIVIALFAADRNVLAQLENAEEVFIPSIVVGELHFGARKSSRIEENLTRVDDFTASNVVLNCDAETARGYGQVKDSLREKGQPIPENDVWIAAIALQHALSLVTRDAHFEAVDNLDIARW